MFLRRTIISMRGKLNTCAEVEMVTSSGGPLKELPEEYPEPISFTDALLDLLFTVLKAIYPAGTIRGFGSTRMLGRRQARSPRR